MSETQNVPELSKPYDSKEVEGRWYAFWEQQGVFEAVDDAADARPVMWCRCRLPM